MCETESVCLSCSKINSITLTRVNDLDYDGISILEKLRDFVSPDLVKDHKFLKICQTCKIKLNSYYKYKKSVLKSMKSLNCLEESITFKEDSEIASDEISSMDSAKDSIIININHNFMNHENKEDINNIIEQIKTESGREQNNGNKIIDNLNCNQCYLSFESRYELQQHISKIHKTDFTCMFCGNMYKTSFHLKEHITSHTGEKNYNCTNCDKAFPRLSSLKRHMKSHFAPLGQKTKKTPFLCTICGKRFPFSNGASRHMRIHFGVKTHECQICNKKFNQSTHLHVHMRTHSGEKPYVCENCGECFTLKAGLHKHLKTHHKEDNQGHCKLAADKKFSLENDVGEYFNNFSFAGIYSNVPNMRLPIYLICAAFVLAIEAEENAVDYYGSFLEPMKISSEREPLNNYMLPKVSAKYRPEWVRLPEPSYYMPEEEVNADADRLNNIAHETRIKRAEFMRPRGSLSIVNSLDALRNKLVMEISRKKTQQNAERNRQFLKSFGKRTFSSHRSMDRFDNNI
ncbi:hypothetical protein WA026_000768 [Henosepilachna vigintioctopunctata]|uniref:C2H2-type domain-containing protein n=1 Tax=Henosepilachna vigintioctopunctata TaxID=420089 RepID=A0AAW1V6Z2_9CUCU